MSYDFSLKLPKALQSRRRKDGSNPEAELRMARVCDALRRADPDMVIDDDDGFITAHGTALGDIYIEPNRVSLAMTMGTKPRDLYNAIHGLMGLLHDQEYVASDPQLRAGTVEFRNSFAEFMQQYREHFDCPDGEFLRWCQGETPPEWTERAKQVRAGAEMATRAFPRDEDLAKWQGDCASVDDQWKLLLAIIAEVDRRIEEYGLGAYMLWLARRNPLGPNIGPRRLDGTIYPSDLDAAWYAGSLMRHEQDALHRLRIQGYPPAVQSQPHRLTLRISRPFERPADARHEWDDLIRGISRSLIAANIAHRDSHSVSSSEFSEWDFYGTDADAMHGAAYPVVIGRFPDVVSIRRYGGIGATEVRTGSPEFGKA
jgi:hypothetical protein